jgi:hypothetical protein
MLSHLFKIVFLLIRMLGDGEAVELITAMIG